VIRPSIEVNGLSVVYPLITSHRQLARTVLLPRTPLDEFWALRDVSFEVMPGGRLGIIGPNGAGKSTLLRTISGNIRPTKGTVQLDGKVSALWSNISFWNPDQSGTQNAKANLQLQGLKSKDAQSLLKEIEDFVELGSFMEMPVRTYSTGMGARLMFAIATAVTPEILIIDEALSAGDGYFAAKATRRVMELSERGKALLFVSHSTAAVRQMCESVLWLENGEIRELGDASRVIANYELDLKRAEDLRLRQGNREHQFEMRETVQLDHLPSKDYVRMRLVSKKGTLGVRETRLIEYIRVEFYSQTDGEQDELSLVCSYTPDQVDSDQFEMDNFSLQLVHSEWGRVQVTNGKRVRVLGPAFGRMPGGHFEVLQPKNIQQTRVLVFIRCGISTEIAPLSLQVLNPKEKLWSDLDLTGTNIDNGSVEYKFETELTRHNYLHTVRAADELATSSGTSAQVIASGIMVNGEKHLVLVEGEHFEIFVDVEFTSHVPEADVMITMFRSDGTYVFFQSFGMSGKNLVGSVGQVRIRFIFDENLFGAGEYYVNLAIGNGWDFPKNYPYSMVFHRIIEGIRFRIEPAEPGLDFGIIRRLVAVASEVV